MTKAPVAPGLVTAGTDSRYLQPVAKDVYRFQPVKFALKDTEMIHGTNEHMTLQNLEFAVQFYAADRHRGRLTGRQGERFTRNPDAASPASDSRHMLNSIYATLGHAWGPLRLLICSSSCRRSASRAAP